MKIDYLCGIIDGEGYVGIVKCKPQIKYRETKPRYKPTIVVVNTNKKLIEFLSDNYSGTIHKRKGNSKHKIVYSFEFSHKTIKNILPNLIENLIVKKEQAKCIHDLFLTMKHTYRNNPYTKTELNNKENIYLRCKKLNKRGR